MIRTNLLRIYPSCVGAARLLSVTTIAVSPVTIGDPASAFTKSQCRELAGIYREMISSIPKMVEPLERLGTATQEVMAQADEHREDVETMEDAREALVHAANEYMFALEDFSYKMRACAR